MYTPSLGLFSETGIGDVSHFEGAFEGPTRFETFPLAVYSGLFAYAGW